MGNWNKYGFLEDLKKSLVKEINDGYLEDADSIYEHINCEIADACIYYSTCFEIAIELNLYDFTDFELGTAKNISQLAYFGLDEYVTDNFDFSEIELLIEEKNNEL